MVLIDTGAIILMHYISLVIPLLIAVGFELDQNPFSLPNNIEKKVVWLCKTNYTSEIKTWSE